MTTDKRAARLQGLVQLCAWWLAGQGAFFLLIGDRLAAWLNLRWMPSMAPYLRLSGLSLLALALFVHRGVEQARRQYLAVDTLLLYLLGLVFLTLSRQVGSGDVTLVEWLSGAISLGLASGLLVLRTRSRNMHQAGALLVMDASQLVRQTGSWIAGTGPKPKADLGPLGPEDEAPKAAPVVLWTDGSAPLMPPAMSVPPPPGPAAPAPPSAPARPTALADEDLLALPLESDAPRSAPLVPPAPRGPASVAPLPPPTPTSRPGRSEAVPRLD